MNEEKQQKRLRGMKKIKDTKWGKLVKGVRKLRNTLTPALLASSSLGICGLDAITYEVHGDLINFSKVGFNNSPINPIKGLYPTGTFVELTGKLESTVHLGKGWSVSLGGALGGMPYDNTRYDTYAKIPASEIPQAWKNGCGANYNGPDSANGFCVPFWDPGKTPAYGSYQWAMDHGGVADPRGIGYMFMGEWNGLFPNYYPASAYTPGQSRRYEIYKANVQYKSDKIWIIAGRYDTTQVKDIDWFYQLTQGFYGMFKLTNKLTFQVFSSWGRGIADGQWMFPIYREKPWGEHKVGFIYQVNKHFSIHPHVWFAPEVFTAPEIKMYYDTNPEFSGRGFRSQTTFYGMYVYQWNNAMYGRYAPARYNTWDPFLDGGKWRGLQGPGGATILIKERLDFNNYNVGFGIYDNIGNPNPNIGTYGNPVAIDGVEQWTGGIYSLGFASINNITDADAFTVYAKTGAVYGKFDWELAERYTTAPRADGQALALYLDYQFGKHIKAGIKLEWFFQVIRAGYNPGVGFLSYMGQPLSLNTGVFSAAGFAQGPQNTGGIAHTVWQDRSHLMTHISYSF
ncbi:Outer membrane protein [Helicobacter heilmannii ASB1.4]|nr:Outer membrane protein [Helicobacter heilmannii ASB1.4]